MIRGYFEGGSPFIKGLLSLPGLGIMNGVETSFLLDTGAEITSVMPSDGPSLGIDYSQLTGEVVLIWGVSGFIEATRRRAHILFTEDDGTCRLYDIDVVVMPDQ